MTNPYIPKLTKIIDIGTEKDADDLKSFTLEFVESKDKEEFFNNFIPGQFVELTEFGFGEIPLGVANSPTEVKNLLFTVKKAGMVTDELFNSEIGKTVGVRGPYGEWLAVALPQRKEFGIGRRWICILYFEIFTRIYFG